MKTYSILAAAVLVSAANLASAQLTVVFADRTGNKLWRLSDANNDGIFDVATEMTVWFDATNAAGTPTFGNPSCLMYRPDGLVAMGDQSTASIFLLQDNNGDGDAQDFGESRVVASPGNGSGINVSFPSGAAFDANGDLYIVNAGSTLGADAIYSMIDVDHDGKFQSAGEILPYVTTGAFGAVPNGPYSPQEILFFPKVGAAPQVGLLRNSSTNLHGIYKFIDANNNHRADDSGEFTPWFTNANASGVTISAGLPIEPDLTRPGAVYFHQIVTGGIDQIYRVQDLNNNGNANDAGEARLVYTNSASGFTMVDLVCLPNGDLLVTDNSGKKIYRLHDADNDGLFSASEASVIFSAPAGITDVRQIILIPASRRCPADFNQDGGVDGADVGAFFAAWEAGENDADVNFDGGIDGQDVEYFFVRWEAGGC